MSTYVVAALLVAAQAAKGDCPRSELLVPVGETCFVRSASSDGRFLGCRTSGRALQILDRDTGASIVDTGATDAFDVYGPVMSPDGTRLAASYVAANNTRHELRVIDATGASRVLYETADASGEPLAWSQDGKLIAAYLGASLVVLPTDGTPIRTLADFEGAVPRNVSFSPDARHILFTHFRDDEPTVARDVFILDIDSRRMSRLTSLPGEELFPQWLADGTGIFFLRSQDGVSDAWLLPMNGAEPSGPPRILRADVGDIAPVALTDDGDLFFTCATEHRTVQTAEIDFTLGQLVTPPRPAAPSLGGDTLRPAFSPDGRNLSFVWLRGWGPRTSIVVHDFEREELIIYNLMRSVELPVWSNDATALLMRGIDAHGNDGTFTYDPNDGQPSSASAEAHSEVKAALRAASDAHLEAVQSLVMSRDVRQLTIHPDGRRIAYVSGETVFEQRMLNNVVPTNR